MCIRVIWRPKGGFWHQSSEHMNVRCTLDSEFRMKQWSQRVPEWVMFSQSLMAPGAVHIVKVCATRGGNEDRTGGASR